jgi:hypothetical protein
VLSPALSLGLETAPFTLSAGVDHVLSIDGQNYSTRFQPAKEPNSRQMRIVLDSEFHRDRKELYNEYRMGELLSSPLSQERAFATNLIVNFFDGGPNTFVEYGIGKREPPLTCAGLFAYLKRPLYRKRPRFFCAFTKNSRYHRA